MDYDECIDNGFSMFMTGLVIGLVIPFLGKIGFNPIRYVKNLNFQNDEKNSEETENENKNKSPIAASSSEKEPSSGETEGELAQLFEEEHQRQQKTTDEVLDMGRDVGSEPVVYPTQRGGGYASNRDLEQTKTKSDNFKKKKLSRADELEIMHTFKRVRGMNYHSAKQIVQREGYTLHPIYINNSPKYDARTYSGTVIGVNVSDSNFNPLTFELSSKAKIISIIDIGGQDNFNRGKIQIPTRTAIEKKFPDI